MGPVRAGRTTDRAPKPLPPSTTLNLQPVRPVRDRTGILRAGPGPDRATPPTITLHMGGGKQRPIIVSGIPRAKVSENSRQSFWKTAQSFQIPKFPKTLSKFRIYP